MKNFFEHHFEHYYDNSYKVIKLIIFLLAFISLIATIFYTVTIVTRISKSWSKIEKKAQNVHKHAFNRISNKLDQLPLAVDKLAQELNLNEQTASKITKTQIEELLKRYSKEFPNLSGFGIAFSPAFLKNNQLKSTKNLFAPYVLKQKDKLVYEQIEKKYDYSKRPWYNQYLRAKDGIWLNPFFSTLSDEMVVEYGQSLSSKSENSEQPVDSGVIFASYSLKKIRELLAQLALGPTGYGFIITQDGTFVAHPVDFYVKNQVKIEDLANNSADTTTAIALHSLGKDQSEGWLFDPEIGKNLYVSTNKLKNINWQFVTVFIEDESVGLYNPNIRSLFLFLIVSLTFFLIFTTLALSVIMGSDSSFNFWLASLIISTCFALGIIFIWYLQVHYIQVNGAGNHQAREQFIEQDEIPIVNYSEVEQLLDKIQLEHFKIPLVKIPTGINLRHLILEQKNQVDIAGYVWQKTPKNLDIDPGVIFPAASTSNQIDVFKTKKTNYNLNSWNVTATLHNKFDYLRYPFDSQKVVIQLKPKDPQENLVLIPDFSSYPFLNPDLLPGILPSLNIAGWQIDKSYFSYSQPYQNANLYKFGSYLGEKHIPQLFFNVVVSRNFFDPFITYIAPLLLACFFLFIILLIEGRTQVWQPIGLLSGLFFGIVLAHLNLRNQFAIDSVVYLEYFFLVVYIIMMLTILTIFLIATDNKSRIIQYKTGIIPKILYWPLLLGLWFTVTVVFFS